MAETLATGGRFRRLRGVHFLRTPQFLARLPRRVPQLDTVAAMSTAHVATGRIPIRDVAPLEDGGRWPAKAVVGEAFAVTATIFREGHDAVGCERRPARARRAPRRRRGRRCTASGWSPTAGWRRSARPARATGPTRSRRGATRWPPGTTRPRSSSPPGSTSTWRARRAPGCSSGPPRRCPRPWRRPAAGRCCSASPRSCATPPCPPEARLAAATTAEVPGPARAAPAARARQHLTALPAAGGPRARPVRRLVRVLPALRGCGHRPHRQEEAEVRHLPHGHGAHPRRRRDGLRRPLPAAGPPDRHDATARARTTPSTPGPYDPGVPWAIGSADGRPRRDPSRPRHDRGLRRLRGRRPSEHGLEIALDYALQASPDHPWVTTHPDWFSERADGSIAYAENPPKKYQDIYPLNFDRDYAGPLRRGAAGAAALDGPRRPDLPGRQPAHQAGALLGAAARRDPRRPTPTCCSWPRRSRDRR